MKFRLIAEFSIFLDVFVKRGACTPVVRVFFCDATRSELLSETGGISVEAAGEGADGVVNVRFFSRVQFETPLKCRLPAIISDIGCGCCQFLEADSVCGLIAVPIKFHETIEVR